MIYALIWLLNWQALASSSSEQVIQYSSPQRSYRIALTAKSLNFQGSPSPFSILINDCNRQIVQNFWQAAVKDIQKLPAINSKSAPLQPRVQLNKQLYWIVPMGSASSSIRDLNQAFIHLAIEENQSCKKL